MGLWAAIKLGLENIFLHKLRSFLTILGMVFGVGAVISMLSIGSGAREEALEQVRALGIDNIWIKSQKPPEPIGADKEPTELKGASAQWGLTVKDAAHLKAVVPNIKYLVVSKEINQVIRSESKKANLPLVATEPNYLRAARLRVAQGRFLTPLDLKLHKKVCVLGSEAKRILFGPYKKALKKHLRIGPDYFTIVGLVKEKLLSKSGRNINRVVWVSFVPELGFFNTEGMNEGEAAPEAQAEVTEICLKIEDETLIEETDRIIRHVLNRLHPQEDYEVIVPYEILAQGQRTHWIFSIIMGSIAGISLLVGGIGIMNIMLATVTERTKEIGIRRAVGARRKDIIKQFLIETLVLTSVGGLIGILVGIAGAKGIPLLAGGEYQTVISVYPILASFLISLSIGIIFGMYPAYKAANISPIEALRYE